MSLNAETIRISYLHGTPNSFLGKELLKRVYEKAGIPVRFEKYSSDVSLALSSQGKIDGETHRIYRLANSYPDLIRVPTAFSYVAPTAFVNQKSNIQFEVLGWPSLMAYRIGAVRGIHYVELGLGDMLDHIELVGSSDQLMRMLSSGRIDIAITGKLNGHYHIHMMYLKNLQALTPSVGKEALYHYLHKKHQDLVPILDQTIKEMIASGELMRLRKKLSNDIIEGRIQIDAVP